MKEWCLKHPILTFFIIDEVITAIQNIATNRSRPSMTEQAVYDIKDAIDEANTKKAEDSKQPIGFAV